MKKIMIIGAAIALLVAGAVMAATVDVTTSDGSYGNTLLTKSYTTQNTIDLSAVTVASNDTVQVLVVPAQSLVEAVLVEVETATGSYTTVDVGDGVAATQYLSNTSSTNLSVTAAATSTAKVYTSADTIDVHFDGDPGATGVIRVKALVTPLRADRDY